MKYAKFTTARFSIAPILGLFITMIGLIGCTRDDISDGLSTVKDCTISLGVEMGGSLTKNGTASSVEYLGSEYLGTLNGEDLYLRSERTPWEEEASTKVTPYTSVNKLKEEAIPFGVAIYKQPSSESDANAMSLYGGPMQATYQSAGYWKPGTDLQWPNEGKHVHFFVYAPYNNSLTFTTPDGGAPTLAGFSPAAAHNEQVDLLYANNVHIDNDPLIVGASTATPYKLTFNHALAAIRFKVVERTPSVDIEYITIKSVFDNGTLNLYTGVWEPNSLSTSNREYTISDPELETTHRAGDDGYFYFKEEQTLMMIPNLSGNPVVSKGFPSAARVDVKFKGVDQIYSTNLSSHAWRAGYYTTYIIDNHLPPVETYVFDVTEEPTYGAENKKMDYTGTAVSGQIVSYKYPASDPSAKTPVGWSVEGYYTTEQGAQDADYNYRIRKGINGTFITGFTPIVGEGSVDGETYTVSHPGATPSMYEKIDNATAKNQAIANTPKKERQSGKAYNLSNPADPYSDVVMNTANTYIINGAGYYRFPIVMGNGVKNGGLNSGAYQQTGFEDYKGNAITNPYLRGTNGQKKPTYAYLVWEDKSAAEKIINVANSSAPYYGTVGNDITSFYLDYPAGAYGITSTGSGSDIVYWVNFHVETATKQGVAHIAVQDEDGVNMWSWLIWLTDYKLGESDIEVDYLKDLSNPSSGTGKVAFMAHNLGWVDDGVLERANYPRAEVYLRLVQSETGNSAVVKLIREEANNVILSEKMGHNPYYQWGRPTPLKPGNGITASASEVPYNQYGGYYRWMQIQNTAQSVGGALRVLEKFIINAGQGWLISFNGKLWNAGNSDMFTVTSGPYTDEKVTKTIYDPSPVGYTVPRGNAFSAFSIGLDYPAGISSQVGNSYKYERGRYFYTNYRSSQSVPGTGSIYMPGIGCRAFHSGALTYSNQTGYYWTALPHDVRNANYLYTSVNGSINIRTNYSAASGNTIRPQREE